MPGRLFSRLKYFSPASQTDEYDTRLFFFGGPGCRTLTQTRPVSPKNASGPVGIPLKSTPLAPVDKPYLSEEGYCFSFWIYQDALRGILQEFVSVTPVTSYTTLSLFMRTSCKLNIPRILFYSCVLVCFFFFISAVKLSSNALFRISFKVTGSSRTVLHRFFLFLLPFVEKQ